MKTTKRTPVERRRDPAQPRRLLKKKNMVQPCPHARPSTGQRTRRQSRGAKRSLAMSTTFCATSRSFTLLVCDARTRKRKARSSVIW